MTLDTQIQEKARLFKSDSYPMSIGEIINLYNDDELIINPNFQRFYRWSTYQKSRLIESILLGVPIPSVFVYQRDDGVWELVDGLQRISTILEFTGNLRDKNGEKKPYLKLQATDLLPSLQDLVWMPNSENIEDENLLSKPLQLYFKRSKIKFEIIQKESDPDAKFEVFDRLNTGGSFLSDQELRNSSLILMNEEFYDWLYSLSENHHFKDTISISERLSKERYDMELALKFISLINFDIGNRDVSRFISESMKLFFSSDNFNLNSEKIHFESVFEIIHTSTSENAFKKHNGEKFLGQFLESAYEAITFGVSKNIDMWSSQPPSLLSKKIKNMWTINDFTDNVGAGTNARARIPKVTKFGEDYFSKL